MANVENRPARNASQYASINHREKKIVPWLGLGVSLTCFTHTRLSCPISEYFMDDFFSQYFTRNMLLLFSIAFDVEFTVVAWTDIRASENIYRIFSDVFSRTTNTHSEYAIAFTILCGLNKRRTETLGLLSNAHIRRPNPICKRKEKCKQQRIPNSRTTRADLWKIFQLYIWKLH